VLACVSVPLLLMGCGDDGQAPQELFGSQPDSVTTALSVPSGVLCVRLTAVAPSRTVRKVYPVTGGNDETLSLGRLPDGTVTLSGEAYDTECPASGTTVSSEASWFADPVTFDNVRGASAKVTLYFEPSQAAVVQPEFGVEFISVHTSGRVTLAIDGDANLWRWGNSAGGRPVKTAETGVRQAMEEGGHECILKEDGALTCVFNSTSSLTGPYFSTTPTRMWWQGVKRFALAHNTICYEDDSNAFYCEGDDPRTPGLVYEERWFEGPSTQVAMVGSGWCSRGDGQVRCIIPESAVGYDTDGNPGVDALMNRELVGPLGAVHLEGSHESYGAVGAASGRWELFGGGASRHIPALHGATRVHHEAYGVCGLMEDGAIHCWAGHGASYGLRGDGTETPNPDALADAPAVVALPLPAEDFSSSRGTSCALLVDHSIWCWGANATGALGDGTREARFTPVRATP